MLDVRTAVNEALAILDRSEPLVRDAVESELFGVTGANSTKRNMVEKAVERAMQKITAVRTNHVKAAFRHLRATLGEDGAEIYGRSLSAWAQQILVQDLKRTQSAINIGIMAGNSNTDIAHRVIGSRVHRGVNGMTEITRQHIQALGLGCLRKRKTRMSGASTDGPAE